MSIPARARDLTLAGGLAALGELELFAGETYNGKPVWPGPRWLAALLILALTAPLLVRRSRPELMVVLVFGLLSVNGLTVGSPEAATGFVLLIVATFSAAAYGARLWLVALAVGVDCLVFFFTDPSAKGIQDQTWVIGLGGVALLLGRASWDRQKRIGSLEGHVAVAEAWHAEEVERVIAAERGVMARELHDIVSHAVSVIVIQAQAGRRSLPSSPDVAAGALVAIEDSARTAMTELRRLLTLLGPEDTPQEIRPVASLAQLDELLGRWRAAGLEVELLADSLPPLPPAVDLAAYRIVQEALTNTARHAPGSRARVTLTLTGDQLEVLARDFGGLSPSPTTGTGRGIIGMRRRVELVGGELVEAGQDREGFVVRARLPLATTISA